MDNKFFKFASGTLISVAMLGCAGTASLDKSTSFELFSPDLAGGSFSNEFILNGFGCSGANISPELRWKNAPEGTKAFAINVLDVDAPTGNGFWHWTVYNIPAASMGLPRGAGNSQASLPQPAFGGNTDFVDTGATKGNGNYGGPCPPTGDKPHHYVFTIYAYGVDDIQVAGGVPKTGSAALYGFVLNKGIGNKLLGKASFTATYGR